jgi:hypothetical protein
VNYKQIIKKQTTIIALSVIGMCLIIISTSYALFMKVNTSTNNQVVEAGTLTTTYSNGSTLTTSMVPQSDTDGLATTGYAFSVTNTGTLPMKYEITIYNDPDVTLTNEVAQQYIRISLDNGTPRTLSGIAKTSDTATETNENNIKRVLSSGLVIMPTGQTGDVATHNVKLWIDEDAPESIIGKTVALEISVNGVVADENDLASKLLINVNGSATVKAKTAPTFSSVATTELGLYATSDDYGTSYYYRGTVTNNNVIFGGFCWKVIRINGNGTTRMIYNGTPTSGQCTATGTDTQIGTSAFNTTYNDNAYVGYMYGTAGSSTYSATHANTNSSTIKTAIDTWYNTNLSTYAAAISDTEFCDDRSLEGGTGIGTAVSYYGSHHRLVNDTAPILTCPNQHDRFTVSDTVVGNGNLTVPIGLVSSDELAMAGGVYSTVNASSYLYTGTTYWTMSSYSFTGTKAYTFDEYSDGKLFRNQSYDVNGIRPVINLKQDTLFSSGDGTTTTPYLIS